MKILTISRIRWHGCWTAVGVLLGSWPMAFAVFLLALRFLTEHQRRITLLELVERAPKGSVIVQGKGAGGPTMWVQVGQGAPAGARSSRLERR